MNRRTFLKAALGALAGVALLRVQIPKLSFPKREIGHDELVVTNVDLENKIITVSAYRMNGKVLVQDEKLRTDILYGFVWRDG